MQCGATQVASVRARSYLPDCAECCSFSSTSKHPPRFARRILSAYVWLRGSTSPIRVIHYNELNRSPFLNSAPTVSIFFPCTILFGVFCWRLSRLFLKPPLENRDCLTTLDPVISYEGSLQGFDGVISPWLTHVQGFLALEAFVPEEGAARKGRTSA